MSKKVIEKKQFAVLGLGNFGFSLAQNLESFGCEVIAVDSSEERIQEIADDVSYAMRAELNDPDLIQMLGARNLDGKTVTTANFTRVFPVDQVTAIIVNGVSFSL